MWLLVLLERVLEMWDGRLLDFDHAIFTSIFERKTSKSHNYMVDGLTNQSQEDYRIHPRLSLGKMGEADCAHVDTSIPTIFAEMD